MFEILDKICTPTRGTKYSACVDLRAREDVAIKAGETKMVPLGIKIDLTDFCIEFNDEQFKEKYLKTHYLQLMLRSGLGKIGLSLPHGVGIIDLDFKDEIMIIINNSTQHWNIFEIKKGDRVAQITLLEHKSFMFDIYSDKVRSGGFGSTGQK